MNTHIRKLRLSIITAFIVGMIPTQAFAAIHDATFELHPHCIEREGKDGEWLFGPIPSPGIVLEIRDIDGLRCLTFEIEDPQTLRTRPLRKGDILDIDVVIDNPGKRKINRVRVWLSYDPNMLEGESLEINEKFDVVTPDEKDFSPDEGYVKIEASKGRGNENGDKILVARIQFKVIETNPIGTPITFHDVQPGGHSVIMADNNGEQAYVVKEEPGVLLVKFAEEEEGPTETIEPEETEDDIAIYLIVFQNQMLNRSQSRNLSRNLLKIRMPVFVMKTVIMDFVKQDSVNKIRISLMVPAVPMMMNVKVVSVPVVSAYPTSVMFLMEEESLLRLQINVQHFPYCKFAMSE